MKRETFMNGTYLNTLNRELKQLLSSDEWYHSARPTVLVNITRFEQLDSLSPGRNRVSDVVQLITRTSDATSVYFLKQSSRAVSLYIQTRVRSHHGFGSNQSALIVYQDSKGRKQTVEVSPDEGDGLSRFTRIFNSHIHWSDRRVESKRSRLAAWFADEFRHNSDLSRGRISSKLKRHMEVVHKCKIMDVVPFTDRIWFMVPKYVKRSKQRIELGCIETSTYNSLPFTVEIELRKSEPKLLRLSDLKIEERGYYSHDDKMKIRPEHLRQVQAFSRRFKANSRQG